MNKLHKIRRLFWVCLGVWLAIFACKLLVVDGLLIAAHLYAQQHFDEDEKPGGSGEILEQPPY
ncbi:hypothetical protein SDC9_104394 [bioreactor metagenome]|uniref:Lipoprotein n=1 Tax=bioreactor metagenome TaxID=1076179 RepID=A0A645AWE9_9ZZZZ